MGGYKPDLNGELSQPTDAGQRRSRSGDSRSGSSEHQFDGGVASTITSSRADLQHQPSVVMGVDCYNQNLTGSKSMTIRSTRSDSDRVPCVVTGGDATTLGGLAMDGYNGSIDDKASTLGVNCGMSTGRNGVMVLNDQGGAVMNVTEDTVNTLRAQDHGHAPCVLRMRSGKEGGQRSLDTDG